MTRVLRLGHRARARLRTVVALAAATALVAALSGCVTAAPGPAPTVTVTVTPTPAPEPSSTSAASSYAKESTCALGEAGIALLVAGGTAAQAFASLVAEHVDDPEIRRLAEQVRDAADTAETRDELAEKLGEYCEIS